MKRKRQQRRGRKKRRERGGEGATLCPGAIMGMHFLAITAGGFGWVRVGSEQEKEEGKGTGFYSLAAPA